ncbi:MAG: hypothetical protein HYY49_04510 [Ignavibacteriales bacterium]|nr:hypothetical protein [Ignavibacteriales bacterium]
MPKDKQSSAIERAREYGIDISLLESSLRMTVEQRLRRLQDWVKFAEEVKKARNQLYPDLSENDSIRRVAEGSPQ